LIDLKTLPSNRDWARKRQRQMSASLRASMYSTTSAGPEGFAANPVGILSLAGGMHAREATDDSEYQAASDSLSLPKQPVSVLAVLKPTTVPILISGFAFAFLAGTCTCLTWSIHNRPYYFSGVVYYIPALGVYSHK
jgi:hypothetical protein